MEYRQLGQSDVKITPVVLGTWAIGGWMWGGQDEQEAVAAIDAAIAEGITTLDTAPVYGFGYSEELIGRVLAGRRDKVQILTKFGMCWDRDAGEYFFDSSDAAGHAVKIYRNSRPDCVIEECENSLRRLKTNHIDLFQCHWRDHTTPVEETAGALAKLLKSGKIRAAGVSNFTVEEIETARQVVPIASEQPPFSMLNRRIEQDIIPYCLETGTGVIAYSPMERGLLTGKVTAERQFPPGDTRASHWLFSAENRRRVLGFLEEIRPVADAHEATLAQLVINWTINRPGITGALVGARNAVQSVENARAMRFRLSGENMRQMDEALERLELDYSQVA